MKIYCCMAGTVAWLPSTKRRMSLVRGTDTLCIITHSASTNLLTSTRRLKRVWFSLLNCEEADNPR